MSVIADVWKNLAQLGSLFYISAMMTLTEVESFAFELPEQQRATLALRILDTLPPLFADSDDGIAEAQHRDSELDEDPGKGIDLEQFDRLIARRR